MVGPFGGNARVLAYDPSNPDHILLGSGAGTLFESTDGGNRWRRFAHLGSGADLMLESIAFNRASPETIYVAGWSISGKGGGFFVTRNGGLSWSEPNALRGKSIQALAVANSDPRILVAGALDGLYRSADSGANWTRISPAGHADLKNFESIAIDPHDPNVIYAGTWHLPWKTDDGGASWDRIKEGVIDDSDVFSIIVDPGNSQTVFASACSGIYKSGDGGLHFSKVQGIPNTARRTRVLRQDPNDPNIVYAGTTEGLWKTVDGGKTFKLISPPDYILNDVLIDPRNSKRVLIATDRGGVFASNDGGISFYPANEGFSQRQVTAVVQDQVEPGVLYVSVINDKEFGGVFRLSDGTWSQLNRGLENRDVFGLLSAANGTLLAATNHGVYIFRAESQQWKLSGIVKTRVAAPRNLIRRRNGRVVRTRYQLLSDRLSIFEGRVTALAASEGRWYAATDEGVLMSENLGKSWSWLAIDGKQSFVSIAGTGRSVAAATRNEVWYSGDESANWKRLPVPAWVSHIYEVALVGRNEIWLATREGMLHCKESVDGAVQWEHVLNGLPEREIISVGGDGNLLLAVSADSKTAYVSRNHGESWEPEPDSPFDTSGALLMGDTLYLTSYRHGILARGFVGMIVAAR